jgi:hypothetical protein
MSNLEVVASDIDAPEEQLDIMQQLHRCRKWIEDALEYSGGTHTYADICRGVLNGDFQLWPNDNGCAVTEITVYPMKKVIHVFLAGGSMSDITDMEESAAAWGKAYGCSAMTIAGRSGWKKVLGARGWKEQHVVLARDI